jgi:hypothetical protein
MIDDMQGLFPTAQSAYEAGKKNGRDDAFATVMSVLGAVSHNHEASGNVKGFKAAEDCCRAVREMRDAAKQKS